MVGGLGWTSTVREEPAMTGTRIGATLSALALAATTAGAMTVEKEPVPYATGGIGTEERSELEEIAKDYNVKLTFASTGSTAFVSEVDVKITGGGGTPVLDAKADGPIFYVKLPPGSYEVSVSFEGEAKRQKLAVGSSGTTRAAFYWGAK
jgi:hypothetical protein